MGNDWFHEYFINELKAIGNHSKCADGKSAYDYAVEGGYTGTETEFAEKMAEEQLTGTTNDLTPAQVYDAVSSGIPVKVQYTDPTFGISSFTAFNVSESMNVIASNAIVNYNNVYLLAVLYGIKSDNRWFYEIIPLAEKTDIPDALPNPNSLTFTGAVTGSYDGSAPLSVEIPTGADGKSAYQYAQEGGYTGTEEEFAEKLASGYNFYIDLAGDAPNYTCQVAMDDIKAAYNAGYNIVCRCQLGVYIATLPLFVPMPDANIWIFSGSGALDGMGFGAQALTIAITANGILAQQTGLATEDDKLPNPNSLTFTGAVTGSYDGSTAKTVNIPSAVTDDHINSLIDTKLGVIENGAY